MNFKQKLQQKKQVWIKIKKMKKKKCKINQCKLTKDNFKNLI